MPLTIHRVPRPKRKRGERADLSIEKIVVAASDVLDETGLDAFSARLVAKRLRVSPAAIYAHFEGGLAGLKRAMAIAVLNEVARPYGPHDTPAEYLRDLFLRMLQSTRSRQAHAQLIALALSDDPLICPVFLERLFAAALGAGKPPHNPALVLDLALSALLGMILVEGEMRSSEKRPKPELRYSNRVRALPPNETPTLVATRVEVMLQIKGRLISGPATMAKTARRYADPVIAALRLDGENSRNK